MNLNEIIILNDYFTSDSESENENENEPENDNLYIFQIYIGQVILHKYDLYKSTQVVYLPIIVIFINLIALYLYVSLNWY